MAGIADKPGFANSKLGRFFLRSKMGQSSMGGSGSSQSASLVTAGSPAQSLINQGG